ncbi:MAG: hypothetical protein AAF657_06105 [Acidobacteriota bacterium]
MDDRRRTPLWLCALTLMLGFSGPAAGAPVAGEARFDGIWEGVITYRPAEMEIEALVELGFDPDGELVGTTDISTLHMKFYHLDRVIPEGRQITFDFLYDSERHGPNSRFIFSGELDEAGEMIRGEFTDGDKQHPFFLRRTGDAGDPRKPRVELPVTVLSDTWAALRDRFNREVEDVRLVMLLSPR